MPPQARVGDASQVPADAHGCPACPHPGTGPAIAGSSNVLTNGLPSVRAGDAGIHAACCGPNLWNAKVGSRSVLINGRPAHRLGDLNIHCGGFGQTIQGSSNVIVGGPPSAVGLAPPPEGASNVTPPSETKPAEKVVLVELVEVVSRSSEGVVVGAGQASLKLKTTTTRAEKANSEYKQFINIDNDVEGTDKRHPEYGRYIEVKARVEVEGGSPSGRKVTFRFELTKGKDRPDGLTGDAKEGFGTAGGTDTTEVTTDGDGWTPTVKFYLSRYAGDTYQVLSEVAETKKAIGAYQVWRKFWYQTTRAKAHVVPMPTLPIAAYAKILADMTAADEVTFDEADAPERTFYPGWMLEHNTGDAKESVIGGHNKAVFYQKFKAEKDKPVKGHLIMCQHQWDPSNASQLLTATVTSNPSAELQVTLDGSRNAGVLKPALRGDLVVLGSWSAGTKSGKLTDDNVLIEKGRSSRTSFKISLPADAPDPTKTPVTVSIKLAYGKFYGGESAVHQMLIAYTNDTAAFMQAVSHEFGHGFGQNPRPGKQPAPLPNHPKHYSNEHGGIGPHCSTDATLVADPLYPLKRYDDGTCIMFHQLNPSKCKQVFCTTCEPYLKLQDMSKLS